VHGGTSLRAVDFTRPTVVVIGNEASGLDAKAIALCQGTLTIPMAGRNESLNAAVAASLIAFEAMWQREDIPAASPRPSL
jgi:tRNA (guanosine-2'-O-)-methyltransferase